MTPHKHQVILVDLDGTLAVNLDRHGDPTQIGAPVPLMVARVKQWLTQGDTVKVFTARVSPHGDTSYAPRAREAITQWCRKNIGQALEVTCVKDYTATQLWDDRAIGVVQNTGMRRDGKSTDEL